MTTVWRPRQPVSLAGQPLATAPFAQPTEAVVAGVWDAALLLALGAGAVIHAASPPPVIALSAPRAIVASAEAPPLPAGSVFEVAGQPLATPPFSQPPEAVVVAREEPQPYPGTTFARAGQPLATTPFAAPPDPVIASQELPQPYPGAVIARAGQPLATTPFSRPPIPIIAVSESPRPDPGSVVSFACLIPAATSKPVIAHIATSEPPQPFPGWAFDASGQPLATTPFAQPPRPAIASSEAPQPYPGLVVALTGLPPTPIIAPARGLLAVAELPPLPAGGSWLSIGRPLAATPFASPPDAVVVIPWEPLPYDGRTVARAGIPVLLRGVPGRPSYISSTELPSLFGGWVFFDVGQPPGNVTQLSMNPILLTMLLKRNYVAPTPAESTFPIFGSIVIRPQWRPIP